MKKKNLLAILMAGIMLVTILSAISVNAEIDPEPDVLVPPQPAPHVGVSIVIHVLDAKTRTPVEGAMVTVTDCFGLQTDSRITDENGKALVYGNWESFWGGYYVITVTHDNYWSQTKDFRLYMVRITFENLLGSYFRMIPK